MIVFFLFLKNLFKDFLFYKKMEELKPLKEPYKKKEYDSFHKGKLFRIGISEPKLSFLGAIECGPKFLNKREPEIYVKELIRNET